MAVDELGGGGGLAVAQEERGKKGNAGGPGGPSNILLYLEPVWYSYLLPLSLPLPFAFG